jgi:hypothetical protein
MWVIVVPDSFPFLNFTTPACKRLIRRAFAPHELPPLVEAIFSSKDESGIARCLHGDDAQIFIDVIDEVRPVLPLHHGSQSVEIDIDVLSTRRWTGLIFRHRHGRNVSGCYTGCAAATHFFQEP